MARAMLALAFLVAAAGAASAQIAVPADPVPDASHTISGSVAYERHGAPDMQLEVIAEKLDGGGRFATYTESSGRFVIGGVPAGQYRLTARAPYKSEYDDGTITLSVYRGRTSSNYPVTITLKRKKGDGEFGSAEPAMTEPTVAERARALHAEGAAAAARGDYETAAARSRAALELSPAYLDAANDLGTYLIRLGRFDDAVTVLREAVEMAPEAFGPRLNLGLALYAKSDLDGASAEIERAVDMDPLSSRALCASGQVALRRGDAKLAIERLQRAYALGDDMQAAAAFSLGLAFEASGGPAQAAEAYRAFLVLEPTGERAAAARDRLRALGAE